MATLNISKTDAQELLVALGWKAAKGKKADWLINKFNELPDLMDNKEEEFELTDAQKALADQICEAVDDEETITIDAPAGKAGKKGKKGKKEEVDEPKAKTGKKGKKGKKEEADEPKAKSGKKGKKDKKEKKEKAEPKAKKAGVISTIITILEAGKAITKDGIVAKLEKAFPDRESDAMRSTVGVQLSRLKKDKGMNIVREGDKYTLED